MSFLSSRTRSARQGFGKPVLRQEDPRLLAGQGCYSDDFDLPRQAYACMVRSPHAHARIRRIDANSRFTVKGTDRGVHLFEAAAAALRPDAPETLRGPLAGAGEETMSVPSYPYGTAVCEVEIDPETGTTEIVRYTTVDDVGRAVNTMILHGQPHGGIAAGVGQALLELCCYDGATGQMQSATFMDYALPRADMFPPFATEISEVPSTSNPLGLRGGGEGGTTPALGAVINAIVDALAELGVEHVEMPATPERVWRAIQDARR